MSYQNFRRVQEVRISCLTPGVGKIGNIANPLNFSEGITVPLVTIQDYLSPDLAPVPELPLLMTVAREKMNPNYRLLQEMYHYPLVN